MYELVLIMWVWMVAGGIAVFAHKESLPGDTDVLTMLILMVAWPWWLSHHGQVRNLDHKEDGMLSPIRVETEDRHRKDR